MLVMDRPLSLLACAILIGFVAVAMLDAADPQPAKPPTKEPKSQSPAKTAGNANPFSIAPKPIKSHPNQPKRVAKKPKPVFKPGPWQEGAAEAAIEKALATTTELDVDEARLQDVIDYLKSLHGIEIQLDKAILADVSINADTPVTINVRGISLKSALKQMLGTMRPELTYMIRDEMLLITTPDIVEENLITKVYDVADLVVCRDERDVLWDDYDTLIDTIVTANPPTRWDYVSWPGSITGATFGPAKVLVVHQTRDIHERIADLLAKIREVAKKSPNAAVPRRTRPTPSDSKNRGSLIPKTELPPPSPNKPADAGTPSGQKPPAPNAPPTGNGRP
jgi:hypothetical protein